MRQRKRTKKADKDLFDQPENLVNGKSGKAEVILFPNGGREIWFKHKELRSVGFCLSFSVGPAGISVTVKRFSAAPPLTGPGNSVPAYDPINQDVDAAEVVVTQYFDTDWAQAFKRWYLNPDKNGYPGWPPPLPLNNAGREAIHPEK